MPKKGQTAGGGGGGGKSKKPPPPADEIDIVAFANSTKDKNPKPDGKGSKGKAASSQTSQGPFKSGAGTSAEAPEGAPKRPDTRTLIGGASWTGKLPVNLLSEHCQRQKWEKPEYTMVCTVQPGKTTAVANRKQRQSKEGFSSAVILKAKNPKTGEVTTLPAMVIPQSHRHLALQPTAVEARHFAASYALFRICSMRNLHMTLPPTYRDLWKGAFQDIKKEDGKERGWMYDDDPFRAYKEQTEKAAAVEKKKKEVAEANARGDTSGSSSKPDKPSRWSRAPKVEMGSRMRKGVESLVRERVVWNPYQIELSPSQKADIIREISKLGFRRSHVEEAADYCKDKEEVLEWLLIHVPEDDAPPWSLPEGYTAGASLAKGDLRREAVIKRLAAGGYAPDLCEEALDYCHGDENRAAEVLQHVLMTGSLPEVGPEISARTASHPLESETWEEEQNVLEAIYGDRYLRLTSQQCRIKLQRRTPAVVSVQLRKPSSGLYPQVPPVVFLMSEPQLPAYIRLAAVKKAIAYAESLLGDQMITSIVDWFEDEINHVVDNPGRLAEVAPAATAVRTRVTDAATPAHRTPMTIARRQNRDATYDANPEASQRMLVEWKAKQSTTKQQEMMAIRQSLPAWRMKDSLVETVNRHRVTIISGETGSGKSTQSVQFILDEMIQRKIGAFANIVCTQPRRISALGLADRVSNERCAVIGQEVGYAIRGESKARAGITRIKFVTTGVLLRQLQVSCREDGDVTRALTGISHVVVDEVHERSLDTDLLLALLRRALQSKKDLKVVLMSATLDADVFADYFGDTGDVGRVQIEGRTYPVEDYYLDDVLRMTGTYSDRDYQDTEDSASSVRGWSQTTDSSAVMMMEATDGSAMPDDAGMSTSSTGNASQTVNTRLDYDLISRAVSAIDEQLVSQDGGILVFLPGVMEIERTMQALRQLPNLHVLPLHASLPPNEQKKVFLRPQKGKRKVIAATNVAETSITIEDIVVVIDSGRVKETSFDPQNNLVILQEVWASRAACKQRRGRAGRAQSGQCFKLFSRQDEATRMRDRPEPEIRRVPLEQLCLSVKAMGVKDVRSFVAGTLTPPELSAVEGAMTMLRRMGALDGDEMTALGRHLAMIPADLRCGKLMVYGATFGCLEACVTIAAILTSGSGTSPFVSPMNKRDEAKQARQSFSRGGQGDLLSDLRAFDQWARMQDRSSSFHPSEVRAWCDRHFLSQRILNDIMSTRSQYLVSLRESGFIPGRYDSSSFTNDAGTSSSSQSTTSQYNRQHENDALIRALIAGSFTPQIARIVFPEKRFAASVSGAIELDPEARTIKYFSQENGRVFVHPSSTLFSNTATSSLSSSSGFTVSGVKYLSYFSKMTSMTSARSGSARATNNNTSSGRVSPIPSSAAAPSSQSTPPSTPSYPSKVFIRDLTPFNVYTLLLFSGPITLEPLQHGITVDGWLYLRGWARIGVLVSRLRLLLDALLAKKIQDPTLDMSQDDVVVEVVRKLVELDGMDQ